jgi:signal transduction histidine kinase
VFYSRYRNTAVESRVALPLMQGGNLLGAIYLMEYNEDQGRLVSALETNVLRISIALEGGIILFSSGFSAAFTRRLRRILNSMQKMRDGDYAQKIRLRGHDELAHLASEFNILAERLDDSEQKRRQFVSDASHELKTPLASIKLLTDSILQNEMDLETVREFVGDIGNEAERLNRMTAKLLSLTKVDGQPMEEAEIIYMTPTVRRVHRMRARTHFVQQSSTSRRSVLPKV